MDLGVEELKGYVVLKAYYDLSVAGFFSADSIFYNSKKPWGQFLGATLFLVILVYSSVFLFDPSTGKKLSIIILVLGLFSVFFVCKSYWLNVPFMLMLLSIVWLICVWLVTYFSFPDRARSGPAIEDYIDKFLFLFIALGLAGSERREKALVGLLILVVSFLPWVSGEGLVDIMSAISGERQGFGLNPIRSGMLAAFVFAFSLVAVVFGLSRDKISWLRMLAPLVFLSWSSLLMLFSQTRAVFVSLGFAALFALPFIIRSVRVTPDKIIKVIGSVMGVALVFGLLALHSGVVDKNIDRMKSDFGSLSYIYSGEISDVPQSSWGYRVIMLRIGFDKILDRPLFGWGYRSSNAILDQAYRDGLIDSSFSQFHNSYIEIFVEYGVVACLVILVLFYYFIKKLSAFLGSGGFDSQLSWSLFLFVVFMAFFSFFDGVLVQESSGPFIFNVAFGVSLSMIWRKRLQRDYARIFLNINRGAS